MGAGAKEIVAVMTRSAKTSVRFCRRSACKHPCVAGGAVFLAVLYKAAPTVFAFLLSASPVLICTTLLLGILLCYGDDNVTEDPAGASSETDAVAPKMEMDESGSDFESDAAESSSPDASMADIIPLFDEFRKQVPTKTSSDSSSEDGDDGEAGEDETKKEGDDSEAAIMWTADDQKNLMDLGYSEMERNRRLESLIARRRSRKNIRFELDQNTTDAVAVPAIVVPRRKNPFELSVDEDNVPGSAPSVLLVPRRNPFEVPDEQFAGGGGRLPQETWSPREFVSASHRDFVFARHESFHFAGDDPRLSRFKRNVAPVTTPPEVSATAVDDEEDDDDDDADEGNSIDVELDNSEFDESDVPELPFQPIEPRLAGDEESEYAVLLEDSEASAPVSSESAMPERLLSAIPEEILPVEMDAPGSGDGCDALTAPSEKGNGPAATPETAPESLE